MKKTFIPLFFPFFLTALSAQNWQPMAVGLIPLQYEIYSISAVDDNVVWAVASGDYGNGPIPTTHQSRVLRSSDGGMNWTVYAVEEAIGTISFRILALDSLTAWITTQDYNNGAGRALYKTIDGGITWTKELTDAAGGVALNRFADGQHWLAHNRLKIARSSDDGGMWNVTSITGYQTDEYQILYSGSNLSNTAGDTLWSGTSAGRILRFTHFGDSLKFFTTPLGLSTTITSIAFQDHLNGLCFSRNTANNNRIARSMDGGATWSVLPQQPGTNIGWNITAVPGSPGFYVLSSILGYASGKVAITKNFGDSWTVEDINKPLNSVVFTSPTSGWLGGGKITTPTHPGIFKYIGSPLVGTKTLPELSGFTLSPNPVSDRIYFDFEGQTSWQSAQVTLADARGNNLFSGKISDKQVDVSHLAPGTYFLKIETAQGVGVRKFVKL